MMKSTKTRVVMLVICACVFASVLSVPNSVARTGPIDAQTAGEEALRHLDEQHSAFGLTLPDMAGLRVSDVVSVADGRGYAAHIQQGVSGVDIRGATIVVVVDDQGRLIDVDSRAIAGAAKRAPSLRPDTTAEEAAGVAARSVGLRPDSRFRVRRIGLGRDRSRTLDGGGIADSGIPARLVLEQGDDGSIKLAWELVIDASDTDDVWQVRIDAQDASEIDVENLTSADSYTVFEQPVEAPTFGSRSVATDPADPSASPFGWHDTDGVSGAEFTSTEGNNVSAYADVNSDQLPDAGRPDGGPSLVFDAALDLAKEPIDSQEAAITNLFYWSNVMHDVLYAYGFDEASGNFQTNNYGNGGLGGDAVRAEAQDGFTTNNANFFTPADGSPPRMQMYLFTNTSPNRDSSFDSGLIAHEYAHGLTNRLTGGPSVATCLTNQEQPGEGWSDYLALMTTIQPGDSGSSPRGFGTYLLGQPTTGPGLRGTPYSTDLAVDPRTYDSVVGASAPHGVGSIFAAMLWDMTWALIDRDGFDPDLISGTGGNITALQLVVDGLKLQPCLPGFVDARDAILMADQINNGSANHCLLWQSFAKRGLGFTATQGDPDDKTDGAEAFDLPAICSDLTVAVSATPSPAVPGTSLAYTLDVTNSALTPLTGVIVTQTVPSGAGYIPGSATCGGIESAGVVTFGPLVVPATSTVQCTFAIDVAAGPGSFALVADDFEIPSTNWTTSAGSGSVVWVESTAHAGSGITSMYAADVAETGDQYLTLAAAVPVAASTELRFAHRFVTENTWDGGVVEVSTNGTVWVDAGPLIATNGYTNLLNVSGSALGGRLAFTGDSGGWITTVVDLSSYAGSSAQVRFRFATDATVAEDGWYLDDIEIVNAVALSSIISATSTEGPTHQTSLTTDVEASTQPGLLRVTTNPAVPSVIEVDGVWTDAFGLDWVELPTGTYAICFNDVPGFTSPPCESATVVPSTTTVVQGNFVTRGTLDITTVPAVASTITIDGAPVNDWGALISIEPGSYEVCFGLVSGWDPPPCETVAVTAGATTAVPGAFTPNGAAPGPTGFGNLRVTTSPAVVSQISIDGVGAQSFGLDWVKLAPGSYNVCFSDVPGFTSPPGGRLSQPGQRRQRAVVGPVNIVEKEHHWSESRNHPA